MSAYDNYQHQYYPFVDPFVLDSFLLPHTTTYSNMSCFTTADHEGSSFSTFFPDPDHETYVQIHQSATTRPPLHKTCSATTTTTTTTITQDDPSLSLKQEYHSTSSALLGELGSSSSTYPVEKKRKHIDSMVDRESRDGKRSGGPSMRNHGVGRKKRNSKKPKKVAVEVPAGFVHVRARRGQATDSHSLAERVRRHKISVRMKLLQSLVPGCDKMTGKALILDEIIRYVKTLQSQVQFLADKVAAINPMLSEFEMDSNTNPLAQEKTSILDFEQLPPVLDSSSTQQLHQEQSSNVPFQDNFNLSWGTNDSQKYEPVTQYGLLHNLHYSF